MHYESLDPLLEDGIAAICDSDWNAAQTLLTQRLDESVRLGRRRLNLFLLSVVAARAGLEDVSSQLSHAAYATPVEMGEPRYFGTSEDPIRRELERQWWSFNAWQPEVAPSLSLANEQTEIAWAAVLDGAMEGRAGELERRWSPFLDGDHPQRAILWNLVALGHLESGDLRTYEEMKEAATGSGPTEVPEPLAQLLLHAGLGLALADLQAGRWLTPEILTNPTPSEEQGEVQETAGWDAAMEDAFSLLSVGQGVDAARRLGPLTSGGSSLQKAYALNALALALFSVGEYGGAEEALADSRAELARSQPQSDPELAARFADWLRAAGSGPAPGEVLCDPFRETHGAAADEGDGQGQQDQFFPIFEQALEGMRTGDFSRTKRHLRALLAEPSSRRDTQSFLISLLFAGSSLLEGDHMEAQDAIDDASRLLEKGGLDPAILVEAQGRFAAAGALTLAGKLELESLSGLDPWRDFPADFAQQSYSGLQRSLG